MVGNHETLRGFLLNCNGHPADAVHEAQRHNPAVIFLTEVHRDTLPTPPGWQAFHAPRPTGRGGGGAALFRAGLHAEEGRRRPADGVLWMLLHGALSGGKTLTGVVYYLPPPALRRGRPRSWRPNGSSSWRATGWQRSLQAGCP